MDTGHGQLDAPGGRRARAGGGRRPRGRSHDDNVLGPQVGGVALGGEGEDLSRGEACHGCGAGVVGIEDGDALWQQAGDDLRLGSGDAFDGSETAHMGHGRS